MLDLAQRVQTATNTRLLALPFVQHAQEAPLLPPTNVVAHNAPLERSLLPHLHLVQVALVEPSQMFQVPLHVSLVYHRHNTPLWVQLRVLPALMVMRLLLTNVVALNVSLVVTLWLPLHRAPIALVEVFLDLVQQVVQPVLPARSMLRLDLHRVLLVLLVQSLPPTNVVALSASLEVFLLPLLRLVRHALLIFIKINLVNQVASRVLLAQTLVVRQAQLLFRLV